MLSASLLSEIYDICKYFVAQIHVSFRGLPLKVEMNSKDIQGTHVISVNVISII